MSELNSFLVCKYLPYAEIIIATSAACMPGMLLVFQFAWSHSVTLQSYKVGTITNSNSQRCKCREAEELTQVHLVLETLVKPPPKNAGMSRF